MNFFKFFLGSTFQDQLNERTHGDTVTVVSVFGNGGSNAVIERVCCCAVDVVGTDTGKVDVGFNDIL